MWPQKIVLSVLVFLIPRILVGACTDAEYASKLKALTNRGFTPQEAHWKVMDEVKSVETSIIQKSEEFEVIVRESGRDKTIVMRQLQHGNGRVWVEKSTGWIGKDQTPPIEKIVSVNRYINGKSTPIFKNDFNVPNNASAAAQAGSVAGQASSQAVPIGFRVPSSIPNGQALFQRGRDVVVATKLPNGNVIGQRVIVERFTPGEGLVYRMPGTLGPTKTIPTKDLFVK